VNLQIEHGSSRQVGIAIEGIRAGGDKTAIVRDTVADGLAKHGVLHPQSDAPPPALAAQSAADGPIPAVPAAPEEPA